MQDIVFLFDVDNTLLDNDHVQRDLGDHLVSNYGQAAHDRYWALFEDLRGTLGYADYLGALQRYRLEDLHNPKVLRIANWLADYPFADRLYPHALDVVRHVAPGDRRSSCPMATRRSSPARSSAPGCGRPSPTTC